MHSLEWLKFRANVLKFCLAFALFLSPDASGAQAQRFERHIRQIDYLDDRTQFQPAWDALVSSLPAGALFFSIRIEDKAITVLTDAGKGKLDRWTVRRGRFLGLFDRDIVSGPEPVPVPSPGFEAALFNLDQIALDRLEEIIDRSIERAALEGPARVTSIEIGSPLIVFPSPHFGQLRVSLRVTSGRETATVAALPDGTIVAADLSQTNRAARLDLLTKDEWPMQEAQDALAKLAGTDAVIRSVTVAKKGVTIRRDNPTNPAAVNFLTWDLSGARFNSTPALNPARDSLDYLPFKLDEADLTRLPDIKKNALSALGAGAQITDIEARKPLSLRGPEASVIIWYVTAAFPGTPAGTLGPWPDLDELAVVKVNPDGTVAGLRLPKRMRKPIDWFSGDAMVMTLKELQGAFGKEARIQEVRVSDGDASIAMEDPSSPGKSAQFIFDDDGLRRDWGTSSSRTKLENAFTLSAFDPTGIERVGAMIEMTYKQAGVTGPLPITPSRTREFSTTLCGSNGRGTPAGTPKLEIRINSRNTSMTYRLASDEFVPDHEC